MGFAPRESFAHQSRPYIDVVKKLKGYFDAISAVLRLDTASYERPRKGSEHNKAERSWADRNDVGRSAGTLGPAGNIP